jgi:hypothetical protein
VFLGVAAEQAIVCQVMASWADKGRVIPSLTVGLEDIAPLLRRGVTAGRKVGDLGPAKGSPFFGDRSPPGVRHIRRASSPAAASRAARAKSVGASTAGGGPPRTSTCRPTSRSS